MRRVLIIIGAVIVLIALGVGAYFLFFAAKAPGITAGPTENPFGEGQDTLGGDTETPLGDGGPAGQEVAPNFLKITDGPVAYGTLARTYIKTIVAPAVGTSTATSTQKIPVTEIRYAERESGNIFAYDFNARTLTRVSNRTLPGIQEASWSPDGAMAFLRFLSTSASGAPSIATYALPVESDEGGFFLENGLDQVLVSGTTTIVTLLPSTTGSIATSARVDGSLAKTLFASNISSLRLYPAGSGYAAFTKASAQSGGFGFLVSSAGAFTRVLGPLKGLTLLPSPSGKSILYSYVSGGAVTAGILDVATRSTTALPVAALPEKCAWSADETSIYCGIPRTMSGVWPDAWYQGSASFSDRIWKIDLGARAAVLIVDPVSVAGVDIDAMSLAIDSRADALVFTNKKDGSLWAFDL